MSLDRLDDNNFINKLLPYAALEALSGYHVFSLQRFLVVSVEVSLQRTRLRERLGTMPTFVRLLAGVNAVVDLEVGRQRERLRTDLTLVRFLAAVDEHVAVEIPRAREHLAAVRTFEGGAFRSRSGLFRVRSLVLSRRGVGFLQRLLFRWLRHRASDHRDRGTHLRHWRHPVHRVFPEVGVRWERRGDREELRDLVGKREVVGCNRKY